MSAETQEDVVYKRIKSMIVGGELPVGEFLSQRMLASRSKTSLIPVRSALRRLEADHLIENVPRWGARIPVDTSESLRDRYFMREILEAAAARHLVDRWTPEQADRLRDLARQCDDCRVDGDETVQHFAELHRQLHLHIASCAGSRMLLDFLTRLITRASMVQNACRGWARRVDKGGNHRSLAEALLSGDPARAEIAMREHVRLGLALELESLGSA